MDVELAHRPGVELVNAGSWQLLSGSWNPNRTDILAAVEAAQCPAVRRPRLKIGHLDPRFNEPETPAFDGTPALGWFDNLRASDDGNTLIGDQVALPWLNAVQAAAYPDRSIEGKHNTRCALGHVHPFVITAVSLLGETPPGIPTLKSIKSLDDLPAALGVAASGEATEGGEDVQATVRAAAGDDGDEPAHTGAMVALIPTAEDAARLAVDGGEPANQLHLTLAYLGEAADLGARGRQDVIDHVSTVCNGLPLLEAELFSVNVFNPGAIAERDNCLVWGVTGDMIDAVHDLVDDTLWRIEAPVPSQHRPWAAHITAAYTDDLSRIPELAERVGPIRFDRIRLAFAGDHVDIPLIEWPGDAPEDADSEPEMVTAAEGNGDNLHDYWTKDPRGLTKWRDKPHPWTALYRHLRKFLNEDRAKRTASQWFHDVFGRWPAERRVAASADTGTVPDLPAAEPEQPNTEPNEEDSVSTELSGLRSRLGLDDTADLDAITAAIDELKTKASTPPAPTEEMVAASAAATAEAERAKAAQELMNEELTKVREELNVIKASAASTVKASFFKGLKGTGRLKPADEEVWAARYDRDPEMVTEILSGRAENSEVPVMASGSIGEPEPTAGSDDEWQQIVARLDGPNAKAS